MKHLIATRKQFKAFGRGTIEFLYPDNPKVIAFIRQFQEESILVVVNLSRHSQIDELDLSRFAGDVPQTLFSKNKFPKIKDNCYVITLSAYGYFRFLLRKEEAPIERRSEERIPALRVSSHWENVLEEKAKEKLEREILPAYIRGCRWFGGKARRIHQLKIAEALPFGRDAAASRLLLMEVLSIAGLSEPSM